MAAATVLGACVELFQATAALAALVPSGIWTGQAPEGKALPLVVVVLAGEDSQRTTEEPYYETSKILLSVFARSAAAAETIAAELKKAFDPATDTLAVIGASTMAVRRVPGGGQVLPEEQRDQDGETVFRATLAYTVMLQKTLGVS